jgi:predicted nucleic acid-binding protein
VIVIVDASVAVKWLVPETHEAAAESLLDSADELVAPDLLLTEVANALWKKALRRELTLGEASTALSRLSAGAIDLVPTPPLLQSAMAIAHRLKHPIYDSIYLALADTEDGVIVTADRRLLAAVGGTRWRRRVRWIEDIGPTQAP